MVKRVLTIAAATVGAGAAILAGLIAFGTAGPPAHLASISAPFAKVDFSDLPAAETMPAPDGGAIAFRYWPAQSASEPELFVIAIHGSSASSASLHPLAKALAAQGLPVYAPDIRGHGGTGRRGDIDYAGQLDSDLDGFTRAVKTLHPGKPLALTGFSAGGGFALHIAGSKLGKEFERVVLLSPYLGPFAPTVRTGGDKWAQPFIPRIIGLLALNRLRIHAFDHLPVLSFAINPDRASILTASYSFRLMRAFSTADYAADLKNAAVPLQVLAGEKDELFDAARFAPAVHAVRPDVPVTIVPGLSHIEMTTDPRAIPAIAAALRGRAL
jgi:alpha-beta hydrolase superfamily lysophospholipase